MNKLEPLVLNSGGSVNEEIVSLHDLSRDLLEGVDEILFSYFKGIFLLPDELRQKVQLLVDACQNGSRDLLKLLVDFHHIVLEFLDVREYFLTLFSAGVDKGVGL